MANVWPHIHQYANFREKIMGTYVLSTGNDYWVSSNPSEQVNVYAGDGNDTVGGGNLDDYLDGGNGNDDLYGFNGNDFLNGLAGSDYLVGRAGNDTLLGGNDWDYLYRNDGDDILNGGACASVGGVIGMDELYGGAGNDIYLHYNNDGGVSAISDSSGTADRVIFNDASIYDLQFYVTGARLTITTASDYSDGYNNNGVEIYNFFGVSNGYLTHGAGEVEYLQVGSSTYSIWGLLFG